jgi:ATP-dependent DNA helicase RecQ
MPAIDRPRKIIQLLAERRGESGIIYCLSRKGTEDLAMKLQANGFKAAAYHAKMEHSERKRVQEEFLKDDINIVCATIAFGMGIDKPNVRFVIHYNMPRNLEGYYQEIGRAGRDSLPSDTFLFYTFADYVTQREMIFNPDSHSSPEWKALADAKLERMKLFAEANQCRRRILISYFSEDFDQNCGNCDVCKNPRREIKGEVLAQKALSAVLRTNEKASQTALADIMRGARTPRIVENQWDKIKTFGAGNDLSLEVWRDYIQQLINMGYIETAFDENYALKITTLGKKVLFENAPVFLVDIEERDKLKKIIKEESKPIPKTQADEIFERMRILRKKLADAENQPPYIIFSDNTLKEIAEKKPFTRDALAKISGMGITKLKHYGDAVLNEMATFLNEKYTEQKTVAGTTHILTWNLWQAGKTPEEISAERNIGLQSILNHFVTLYEMDYPLDVKYFLNKEEYLDIIKARDSLNDYDGKSMKPVFEALEGRLDYAKIKMAFAVEMKTALKRAEREKNNAQ